MGLRTIGQSHPWCFCCLRNNMQCILVIYNISWIYPIFQWRRGKDEDLLCVNSALFCIWSPSIRGCLLKTQRYWSSVSHMKFFVHDLYEGDLKCSCFELLALRHLQSCLRSVGFFLIHTWMSKIRTMEVMIMYSVSD